MSNRLNAILVSSGVVICTTFFGCRLASGPQFFALEEIRVTIIKGDSAFADYDYNRALHHYEQADRWISELIEFKRSSSPNVTGKRGLERELEEQKDRDLLQHYQNTLVFIRARIELTKIAVAARRVNPHRTPVSTER